MERFLKKYGFMVIDHKDSQELERMYFMTKSGKRVGRINGTHRLVRAVKRETK